MANLLSTKFKVENKQFYEGDLGYHKVNNDKFIIYKILTGKKLKVCKIIIDEKNNILKISTKPEVIDQDQFQIYTFALEADTTTFILNLLKLIFKKEKEKVKIEVNYQQINNNYPENIYYNLEDNLNTYLDETGIFVSQPHDFDKKNKKRKKTQKL